MKARRVGEKRDHPRARAEELEAVRGVTERIAGGCAVGEHPAPGAQREQDAQGKRFGRLRTMRTDEKQHRDAREQGPER